MGPILAVVSEPKAAPIALSIDVLKSSSDAPELPHEMQGKNVSNWCMKLSVVLVIRTDVGNLLKRLSNTFPNRLLVS